MMNQKDKTKLRILFDVRTVQSGSYADGFYDALKHIYNLLRLKLSKEQFKSIEELISIKCIK